LFNLVIVRLNSPKLYEIILDYYLNLPEEERDLSKMKIKHACYFIHCIFYSNSNLKNDEFLKIAKTYILDNLSGFNKLQLAKMLDLFKFSDKFSA